MAVFVDKLRKCKPNAKWRWSESCHLTADSLKELHAFAKWLGLKRMWFQEDRPHYDLTRGMRERAIQHGALKKRGEEMIKKVEVPTYPGLDKEGPHVVVSEFAGKMVMKFEEVAGRSPAIEMHVYFEDIRRAWDAVKKSG